MCLWELKYKTNLNRIGEFWIWQQIRLSLSQIKNLTGLVKQTEVEFGAKAQWNHSRY